MVIFEKNDLRISLLTPRLLRTEKGAFTDLPTQTVMNRDLGEVPYQMTQEGDFLWVQTQEVLYRVSLRTGKVVYAALADGYFTKNKNISSNST
jgi:hypothetical protein